jgi:predicted metal-dependent phosphoesterase TrpH
MKVDPKVGSIWLKWDLHAHTPLDPEWINKPDLSTKEKKRDFAKKYVEAALQKELSVIAITDHNFCDEFDNLLIPYIREEADRGGITILPGFELTIKEGKGVHILTIFPEDTDLKVIDTIVTKVLPGGNRFHNSSPVPVSYTHLTLPTIA